ncbi:MAG: Nramp family divalent metal transporter [Pirellulaceae bacterium]
MCVSPDKDKKDASRLANPPTGFFGSLLWMGPMLLLLGTAIGSGELVAEPAAGARYGGSLLWAIIFIIVTKALWNEAIGRVSIVTGQSFLETCSAAGPLVTWVPWFWYAVNILKDFFLRGGIAAIAGQICYDVFGPLPFLGERSDPAATASMQVVAWTLLNYGFIWGLLTLGGYRLAETVNTILSVLFTICLVACAAVVFPGAAHDLREGLVPSLPSSSGEWLMLMTLSGIVMSGSTTVFYSVWAEERRMGLYRLTASSVRRLTRDDSEPESPAEIEQMRGWLRVNRMNVIVTYFLGALICLSTFILGVAVLRPAEVTLTGPTLARELSLMMTEVAGPWARPLFYIGAYAAVISTAIGILDGGSRMYLQPLRHILPRLFERISAKLCQRIIMLLMAVGSWTVYLLMPDALKLVVWMGAVDAPLVGVLIVSYAYLATFYLPRPYRPGIAWTVMMALIGSIYFAFGTYYFSQRLFHLLVS